MTWLADHLPEIVKFVGLAAVVFNGSAVAYVLLRRRAIVQKHKQRKQVFFAEVNGKAAPDMAAFIVNRFEGIK